MNMEQALHKTELVLPSWSYSVEPATNFLFESLSSMNLQKAEGVANLQKAEGVALKRTLASVLELVRGQTKKCRFEDHFSVKTSFSETHYNICIKNHGVPLLIEKQVLQETLLPKKVNLEFRNLGREGQEILIKVPINMQLKVESGETTLIKIEENFTVRKLLVSEVEMCSLLFHSVYGYDYIHEWVYYPEKIKEKITNGDLISLVAVSAQGEFVGHVGLVRQNINPPIYEAGLGVVDPKVKSHGIFQMIFTEIMNLVSQIQMNYCVFDFVTNHDYSQRMVSKFGMCDMALFLGCQVKKTQAKLKILGIGEDPWYTDRYSLILGVHACVANPFGKTTIVLPESLGEMFQFLLDPLGVAWAPASRFDVLALQGEYAVTLQPTQSSVIFDFKKPGCRALDQIVGEWNSLKRDGYKYVAIDIPVMSPGLGQLSEYLRMNGFFVSGFVPYHYRDELGFRFQSIAPAKIDFDEIKVYSDNSKRLLEKVKADYERHGFS
ncbi:MAG: hypothetical protein HY072_01750 [Deltaproteobacteria bacterium]|nr:hypothetical protein [Deltaproteobacteria bacterium]